MQKHYYYVRIRTPVRDYIFLFFAAIIIIILGFLLYRDIYSTYLVDEEPVGKIIFKKRTALRKLQKQNLWEMLQSEYPVYNGDSIKTEEFSQAILQLKDGTEIALNENSFIVVNFTKDEVKINFNYGSLEAKGETDVKIQTGDSEIQLNSAVAKITNTRDAMNIQLEKGQAEIIKEGKKEEIKKDEVLVVSKTEDKVMKTKVAVQLLRPQDDEKFYTASDVNVEFEFSGDPQSQYELQVSLNPLFRPVFMQIPVKKLAVINLKPGTYYWKVVKKGQDPSLFPYRKLTVLKKEKPVLYTPGNREIIKTKSTVDVYFSWSPLDLARGYTLQIDTSPDFSNPRTMDVQTSSVAIPFDIRQNQVFYWRVIAKGAVEALTETSEVYSFQLQALEKLKPSKPVYPVNEYFLSRQTEGIVFKWLTDIPNKQTLQIAKDKFFSEIVFSQDNITGTYFSLRRELPPSEYYWRVINEDGVPSEAAVFSVIETPVLTLLQPRPRELLLLQEQIGLKFDWDYELRDVEYSITLAGDEKFRKVLLETKTSRSEYVLSTALLPDFEGEVFWKVDAIRKTTGEILASKTSSFSLFYLPLPARITAPKNNETFNLLTTGAILIQWEKAKNADSYEYELFRNGEFYLKNRTNQTRLLLNNLEDFGVGVYDFRLRSSRKILDRVYTSGESSLRFRLEYRLETKPEFLTPEIIVIE